MTDKQFELLRHIARSIDRTGAQPSYRDLCKDFGWSSPNAVKSAMDSLEKKGFIRRIGSRAIAFDWKSYLRRRR